jgi:branched-chain amino acid transport system substrate-binding protein
VHLAASQNQQLGNGYTLKLISPQVILDDPASDAHYVQQVVRNPCIVGLIGPYLSTFAAAEMPIAANAGLVMISPATTNPGLTLRPYASVSGWDFDKLHPEGKKTNFFRIPPNDVSLGIEDADFAFDDLGVRGVYIVDDYLSYGKGVAGGFTEGFLGHGGAIVGTATIPFAGFAHIAELASSILAAKPDAVFYGGTTGGGGGQLLAQLDQDGYTGYFVAGDLVAGDPLFVKEAGARPDNTTFAIQPVRDYSTFTTGAAARFLHDYSTAYPGQVLDGYSADAYDAAMVMITAIKHLISSGKEVTREALIDQVQTIKYGGITGPISFDSNGDIAHGIFSIYAVQAGQWTYFQQASL